MCGARHGVADCRLRYNQRWSRSVQNLIYVMLLTAWLGGLGTESRPGELGRLLRIEEIGEILQGMPSAIMSPDTSSRTPLTSF